MLDELIFCLSEKRCHVLARSETTVAISDNTRITSTTTEPATGPRSRNAR